MTKSWVDGVMPSAELIPVVSPDGLCEAGWSNHDCREGDRGGELVHFAWPSESGVPVKKPARNLLFLSGPLVASRDILSGVVVELLVLKLVCRDKELFKLCPDRLCQFAHVLKLARRGTANSIAGKSSRPYRSRSPEVLLINLAKPAAVRWRFPANLRFLSILFPPDHRTRPFRASGLPACSHSSWARVRTCWAVGGIDISFRFELLPDGGCRVADLFDQLQKLLLCDSKFMRP